MGSADQSTAARNVKVEPSNYFSLTSLWLLKEVLNFKRIHAFIPWGPGGKVKPQFHIETFLSARPSTQNAFVGSAPTSKSLGATNLLARELRKLCTLGKLLLFKPKP